MKIVEFKKDQGYRDIYEYFTFLANNHELKYYNTVRTPDSAAFGFINSMVVNARATDADLASYMQYITYTFTLESSKQAKDLYDRFEELLDEQMPDVKCVYCHEDDRLVAVFNKIDCGTPAKEFEGNYELTLRNLVMNA